MIYSSEQFRGNIRSKLMRYCSHLLKAINTSITSTTEVFLSSRSIVADIFYELIGSGGRFFRRGVGGQIFEQYVNRVQELVNQFRACDV